MEETGQAQRTLAVARGGKDALTKLLGDAGISILLEKQITLTVSDAKELGVKNPALRAGLGSKPAHGYVLESENVIQRWLDIIQEDDGKKKYLYGSVSEAGAKQDIAWLRRLAVKQKKPASGASSKLPTPASTARRASSTAATKKPVEERRASTPQARASQKARPSTTARQPARQPPKPAKDAGKSIPRPRNPGGTKVQRAKSETTSDAASAKSEPTCADSMDAGSSSSSNNSSSSTTPRPRSRESSVAGSDDHGTGTQRKTDDDEAQQAGAQPPSPEISAQDVGDAESEHDAEVAATTNHTANIPPEYSMLRTSLSPNSVASLPRPETPEVDQLRQRFESLGQGGSTVAVQRTDRSPETPISVKDAKPKSPGGARVKSMVNFFMDENLHKWEF